MGRGCIQSPAPIGRHRLQLPPPRESAASAFMSARLGNLRGSSTAIRLLQSGLATSTSQSYGRLFEAFAAYCDAEGVSALPAETSTVISYVGHLAELGTWMASSMQPIFSAINDAHRSLELPPPAVDSFFLKRVRTGLGRLQAEESTTDSRTPLPASAVIAFIDAAERLPDDAVRHLREYVALVLTALFAGRQDSSVHLRSEDIGFGEAQLWLRLSEKGKRQQSVRRVVRLPLTPSSVHGHLSVLPRVGALLARYFALRAKLAPSQPDFAFQLPGEQRPTTACMERWLAHALTRCSVRAPPGFAYLGHSLRSLGASAMAAIGVPRHIYIWLGGWARGSSVVDRCYIDPTFAACPAAYALYGWALSGLYGADAGTVVRATTLPDPRLTAPAPGQTLPESPAHVRAARAIRQRAATLARAPA